MFDEVREMHQQAARDDGLRLSVEFMFASAKNVETWKSHIAPLVSSARPLLGSMPARKISSGRVPDASLEEFVQFASTVSETQLQ